MAKKKATELNPEVQAMFPPIGREVEPQDDDNDGDTGLENRLAALEAEIQAERRRNSDLNRQLISQLGARPAANPAPAAPRPVFDFNDLPDPVSDREGFFKKLSERVESGVTAATLQTVSRAEAERGQQGALVEGFDTLWNEFGQEYPELAQFEELVEVQTKKILQTAKKRGIEPDQYAFADPDAFKAEVADAVRKRADELGLTGDDEDDDEPAPRRLAVKRRVEGSTAGTGGKGGGPRATPSKGKKADDYPTFDQQLKDAQRKLGII
jgi:hypothetical protein